LDSELQNQDPDGSAATSVGSIPAGCNAKIVSVEDVLVNLGRADGMISSTVAALHALSSRRAAAAI